MLEEIEIKRRDGIAYVALNRPSVRNAVTLAMWRELAETFSRFAADRDLRAVVLTGTGNGFQRRRRHLRVRQDPERQATERRIRSRRRRVLGRDRRIGKAGRRRDLRLLSGRRLPSRFGMRLSLRRSDGDCRHSGRETFHRLWRSKRAAAVGACRHRQRQTDPLFGRPLSRRAGEIDGIDRRNPRRRRGSRPSSSSSAWPPMRRCRSRARSSC